MPYAAIHLVAAFIHWSSYMWNIQLVGNLKNEFYSVYSSIFKYTHYYSCTLCTEVLSELPVVKRGNDRGWLWSYLKNRCIFLVYSISTVHLYTLSLGIYELKKKNWKQNSSHACMFVFQAILQKIEKKGCRCFLHSTFLSIIHIYFVQISSPVILPNCQFSVILVDDYCKSWCEQSLPSHRALRTGTSFNSRWNREANTWTCIFLLCLSVTSSFKSSFGWRLQNELGWLSSPQIFAVKISLHISLNHVHYFNDNMDFFSLWWRFI